VDSGSYSNEVTEGTSKRRTPGSSAPNSHNGGEEDEGSTDLGASTAISVHMVVTGGLFSDR